MRTLAMSCILLCTSTSLLAQANAPKVFEVASIHPTKPGGAMLRYNVSGPNVTYDGFNLLILILEAYSLESYELEFGPAISRSFPGDSNITANFTVAAKVPGDQAPTHDQTREMLKELLASRFGLRVHREMREIPVYSLVQGKNVKLLASDLNAPGESRFRTHGRNQIIENPRLSMQLLTRELRGFVERPVIDKTGLTGTYDVTLEATPYYRLNTGVQPDDITIFTAIQETLGLRLEPDKAQVSVVVIDAATMPTDN